MTGVAQLGLDQNSYALADQPLSYSGVAGILVHWGYKPVGDHARELWDLDSFLRWEKTNPSTGIVSAFVITSPKWYAVDFNEPVWPLKAIVSAMATQGVFLRTGNHDEDHGIKVKSFRVPEC